MKISNIVFLLLMLFGICASCNNPKVEEERRRQQETIDRWSEMKDETELMAQAKAALSRANSHYDEAMSIVDFISGIDYNNSLSDMNANEITAYNSVMVITSYFDNIEYASKYFDEGDYQNSKIYSEYANNNFRDAKTAYIQYRGTLARFQ